MAHSEAGSCTRSMDAWEMLRGRCRRTDQSFVPITTGAAPSSCTCGNHGLYLLSRGDSVDVSTAPVELLSGESIWARNSDSRLSTWSIAPASNSRARLSGSAKPSIASGGNCRSMLRRSADSTHHSSCDPIPLRETSLLIAYAYSRCRCGRPMPRPDSSSKTIDLRASQRKGG